jgi:methylmalonyl-CoA mutase
MNATQSAAFTAIEKEEWKFRVAKELKGCTLDQLPWEIAQDVFLDHYYTAEENDALAMQKVQKRQRPSANWQRALAVKYESPDQLLEFIHTNVTDKNTSIWIHLSKYCTTHTALQSILREIFLQEIAVYLVMEEYMDTTFQSFLSALPCKGGVVYDPITQWIGAKRPLLLEDEVYKQSILKLPPDSTFRTLCIHGDFFHNRGADPAQELGFILSDFVHTLDRLTDLGVSPSEAFAQTFFSVSVGTQYLTEIAKLRALRFLIYQIADAYGISSTAYVPFIHVNTSTLYHTASAPYLNLIRSTSEAMSAVIGGCDSLMIHAYSSEYTFADHISNNISLLLAHEGHLNTVFDPSSGSYLLEHATQKLIQAGWKKFHQVQNMGGIVEACKNGFVKTELERSFAQKLTALEHEAVLIGVNHYKDNQVKEHPSSLAPISNLEMAYFAKQGIPWS